MTTIERKMSKPFGMPQRPKGMDWFDFIRAAIDAYIASEKFNHEFPTKIYVNPKEIGFLGNARGIQYKGHRVLIQPKQNCLIYHIQIHS